MKTLTVKAKTVYTKELLKKFAWFGIFNSSFSIPAYIIFEIIILLFSVFAFFNASHTFTAVMSVLFPFVMPIVVIVLFFFYVNLNKKLIGMITEYEFNEQGALIESTLPYAERQTKATYNIWQKVYDTKDFYYLYTSKRQAMIMRKSDIYQGSVLDLQSIFRKNLPAKKYKVKKHNT